MKGKARQLFRRNQSKRVTLAMDNMDGAAFGRQAVRLGLMTEGQLREVLEEMGSRNPALDELVGLLERRAYLTPWQTDKLKKGDTDGYILGGYRLLYRVASGSFGRVYRADDPRTGRVIAVKVLRRRHSEDQQKIDSFIREGKLGLQLKHPNIVEVLTISQDPTSRQYFLAMEFVEGDNLRKILQIRKRLKVPEALQIIEDAATGLAYAYSRGVTHRDVKLTNLLISATGHAKLVDFGLAQLFASFGDSAKREKGQEDEKVDRTVDYAGLEKATSVKMGDVRSDIYFLGCVLYEMLTGRSPLAMSRNRALRMQRNRFEEVVPMSRTEVHAPPSLFLLVETMMALNPQRRYQTPSQLLDAVKAVRREVEGGISAGRSGAVKAGNRTVFVVERDERLQDALRDKFKKHNFRVLISVDPARALERFRQQPFDVLVVDAETVGVDGRVAFEEVVTEADRQQLPFAAVLVLGENQTEWAERLPANPRAVVLQRPGVTLQQVYRKVEELIGDMVESG